MKTMSDPDVHPRVRVWTISNLLSCSRIVLAIPIVLLLLHGTLQSRLWAVLIMLVGVVTDFFDGYIARQRNEVTEFGKILDPLADKISIAGVAFVLSIAQYLPVWFFLIIFFRDVIILVGGMWLRCTRKVVLQSNWIGKWAVTAIAGTIVAATLRVNVVVDILIGISCVLLVWSLVAYSQNFFAAVRGKV